MSAHRIEADFPALRLHIPYSLAWCREYRRLHLIRFPDSDQITRANLDAMVKDAKERKRKAESDQ